MSTTRAERRLSAIVATDVVGYSRLIEADEGATLTAIEQLRTDTIDPIIAEHHGRVVKLIGDGTILEFGSIVDAVAAAVAIQERVALDQRGIPAERRIIFRIGINLGDVVVAGDDLLGDGVNVAARLEQLSPPGGIVISGTAYDHLRGKIDLPLDFVGEQWVKNLSQPVRAYNVRMEGGKGVWKLKTRRLRRYFPIAAVFVALAMAVGAIAWWFMPDKGTLAKSSIAVLPFDDIGGDETTGRFADGITEDIITDLSRYREVDVIARNSTAVYKGRPVDIRQVGRELNVNYVLEGSVQRQAEKIRITAQLLEAKTAAHVWSDRWDRPIADLFTLQAEISEQVAGRLLEAGGAITTAEHVANRRKNPRNMSAYELYLQGREEMNRFTKESTSKAPCFFGPSRKIQPWPGPGSNWWELTKFRSSSAPTRQPPGPRRWKQRRARWNSIRWTPWRTRIWLSSWGRPAT